MGVLLLLVIPISVTSSRCSGKSRISPGFDDAQAKFVWSAVQILRDISRGGRSFSSCSAP